MLALRYTGLVALTVWVGGLLVLGTIAAPSVFDVVAARQVADGRLLAGAIVGDTLRRFHLLSYGCGAILLATLMARAILGPRPMRFALRLGIAAAMLAASAYSGLILSARIARAQTEMGVSPSSLPTDDPRRAAFGRLHAASMVLQLVPVLGGLMLLVWETKEQAGHPPRSVMLQYDAIMDDVRSAVEADTNPTRGMERTVALLKDRIPHYTWVGIYLLDGDDLLLGPFAGHPSPHTRIPLGRGICGAAATEKATIVVDDVNADPRYLSCSLETKSEIVVPIMHGEEVLGEIDIDSDRPAAFGAADRALLESVAALLAPRLASR